MQLSKNILPVASSKVVGPDTSLFELPEKVLQFGTGVLLRGLPDYYIDKANKQGVFNGRVVVVKSTDSGGADAFNDQGCLYTQNIRGIAGEQVINEYIINASISRVLSAKSEWRQILDCAAKPDMEIIISNTTEVGITLAADDNVHVQPPASFPGKLLAFLFERYKCFHGDIHKGMVIIPTELIVDNGGKLLDIVLELAELNRMDHHFIEWIELANAFCSSLVDRIVPGKLPPSQQETATAELGYSDELMIMSEVYSLWAIQTSSHKAKEMLSFSEVDETVIITDNIEKYRELKLRLLNGTHTLSCGIAFLAGFDLVKDAMEDKTMGRYVAGLMKDEIAPCIFDENISLQEATAFSNAVIERFRNPSIDHKWLSITLNYTQKIKMRNVPVLLKHYEQHGTVPPLIAVGFAAYLVFMKCQPAENGKYAGERNGTAYILQDEQAAYYYQLWKDHPLNEISAIALSNREMWGTDLTALPGFAEAVQHQLESIMEKGMMEVLKEL
jgi:tagaturonate reductase